MAGAGSWSLLPRRGGLLAAALAAAIGAGLASAAALDNPPAAGGHFADADDSALVLQGRQIYQRQCAGCHGRSLQGQPLWQLQDAYAGRRAPAHDQTGHTWLHADEDLFRMVKLGRFDEAGPATAMPAFQHRLNDSDILAVIAFIKASWPVGLRVVQAMRNPGSAGLPVQAAQADWQFPPTCIRAQNTAGERR
jgi:mono/diheme cytochrome c family protein